MPRKTTTLCPWGKIMRPFTRYTDIGATTTRKLVIPFTPYTDIGTTTRKLVTPFTPNKHQQEGEEEHYTVQAASPIPATGACRHHGTL